MKYASGNEGGHAAGHADMGNMPPVVSHALEASKHHPIHSKPTAPAAHAHVSPKLINPLASKKK